MHTTEKENSDHPALWFIAFVFFTCAAGAIAAGIITMAMDVIYPMLAEMFRTGMRMFA